MNQRVKGLMTICVGIVFSLPIPHLFKWVKSMGYSLTIWAIIGISVPAAIGLTGLLEVITGVPFMKLSNKWDELKGWQRGLIVTLVVILGIGVLFGGLAIWGYYKMR